MEGGTQELTYGFYPKTLRQERGGNGLKGGCVPPWGIDRWRVRKKMALEREKGKLPCGVYNHSTKKGAAKSLSMSSRVASAMETDYLERRSKSENNSGIKKPLHPEENADKIRIDGNQIEQSASITELEKDKREKQEGRENNAKDMRSQACL